MNIYEVQDSIVAQLNATFVNAGVSFTAMNLPDYSAVYQPDLGIPTAYVMYMGSTAKLSTSAQPVTQSRKLSFNIEIQANSLYGDNGLLAAKNLVEQSIIGFEPAGCPRIILKCDYTHPISLAGVMVWAHVLKIETTATLIQQDFSEPIIVPNLKEIINQ